MCASLVSGETNKTIMKSKFGGVFVLAILFVQLTGFAQLSFQSAQPVQTISIEQPVQIDSVVAVTADAYGLEPVSLESVPMFTGTFWIVGSNGVVPPYPGLPSQYWNCTVWNIAGDIYLVDASGGQLPRAPRLLSRQSMTTSAQSVQSVVEAQGNAVADLIDRVQESEFERTMAVAFGLDMSMADGANNYSADFAAYSFDTNALWLEITNVSNRFSYYNLHNATNLVYEILTTTNLLTPFAPELELWPSDPNCQPFNLQNTGRQYLFVRAKDWSGVDSDGDGVPDWWSWKYFGTVNLTDTNLDYSGNGYTFGQDYSNNVTPTVFKYTGLEVPNNYVSSSQPAVQLDVNGTPYYVATLIDDGNFSNAVWNTYSGSTVTVNLGSAQGWHEVWIGLRGHADETGNAVWQRKRLKFDSTPPALFITSPTNNTVNVPMIQLQGYSPESLSSISYDLTNASSSVSNQQVLVLDRYYDPTTWEFTTNYFQAFDVVLTNGVNTFTFHATDLAGNVTTANYSVTLDYSGKTNAPNVQISWPTNRTEISGSRFTMNGQVADATIGVAATISDNNGNTNTVQGLVERTGKFWVDNLPLNSGTNTVTLIVTDAVGNTTATSLNVVQSAVTLTVNAVSDPQQLWHPTVSLTGTISDATYAIWVNGVKGHNNGDGTWSASNVPVNSGGTATFTAIGYASSEQQPDGSYGN